MREFELMFVVDPRLSEEEVVGLSQEFQEMITSEGAQVIKEESWGKRKLAYPINKLNEGYYVLLEVQTEGGSPFGLAQQRMQQSDKVLRYLTVRTDAGRLRRREARVDDREEAAQSPRPSTTTVQAKEESR
jgi:small subunit ribosomal protein S6